METEEAVKAMRLLFFEEADVLFSIYDKDLNCIDVNPATLRLCNVDRQFFVGKNIRDVSPDAVTSGRYKAYQQVIKTGKTLIIDELHARPDHQGDAYFRIKAFKLGSGMGMVTKNITDLELMIHKTVRELEQKVKSLDEANRNISSMMKVLEDKNHQLNDFCGIVSHNLRAPLINLSMLSDFINDCDDHQRRELMFSKIKPVVNTLTETFDHLVESLQVREDLDLTCEKNDFMEVTQQVLKKHSIEIELYKADVVVDFEAAPQLFYPKPYLDSILSNLISNALKYRSHLRQPAIKINTTIDQGKVILKVSDNGSGIDLKMHGHHIFKMRKVFHDHPSAKGFGLFMTKTHVEAMQGKISVESEPGEHATFIVEFNPKNTIL